MKIKISQTAGFSCPNADTHSPSCVFNHKLFLLRGKTVEVETAYLFADQFNTADLRVMAKDVERVIGDIRRKRVFTRWTNRNYATLAEMTPEEKDYSFVMHSTNKDKRFSCVALAEKKFKKQLAPL